MLTVFKTDVGSIPSRVGSIPIYLRQFIKTKGLRSFAVALWFFMSSKKSFLVKFWGTRHLQGGNFIASIIKRGPYQWQVKIRRGGGQSRLRVRQPDLSPAEPRSRLNENSSGIY